MIEHLFKPSREMIFNKNWKAFFCQKTNKKLVKEFEVPNYLSMQKQFQFLIFETL